MEKREASYNVSETVNWCSHYEDIIEISQKKKRIELLYDSYSISWYLSDKHKNNNWKDTVYTPMFTTILYNSQDMEII